MISEDTGVDFSYSLPDVIWDRIIALLRSPSILRKKRLVVQEWMTERLWVLFSTSYVQAVSGMLYQEVLVLQVQYMIDSRSGGKQVYSNVCGSMDCQCMYDNTNRIDWKWQAMDGVITKAPLGGKKHTTKSHRQKKIRY